MFKMQHKTTQVFGAFLKGNWGNGKAIWPFGGGEISPFSWTPSLGLFLSTHEMGKDPKQPFLTEYIRETWSKNHRILDVITNTLVRNCAVQKWFSCVGKQVAMFCASCLFQVIFENIAVIQSAGNENLNFCHSGPLFLNQLQQRPPGYGLYLLIKVKLWIKENLQFTNLYRPHKRASS